MNYKLTEQQINNLMAFLDRVTITGHQERQAMNELCYTLANPIPEAVPEPTIEKTEPTEEFEESTKE